MGYLWSLAINILLAQLVILPVAAVFFWIFAKITMGRCKDNVLMTGKTALVTGGNSGIGYQIALNLAGRGCKVIIADRNNSEESVKKIIQLTNNPNVIYKIFDLGSLDSVRELAKEINETEERLDILFNNAGTTGLGNRYSKDNLHLFTQINHFGPFLLTHLLVDLLKKSAPSRIIFQSSVMAYIANLNFYNLQLPRDTPANGITDCYCYANSKLCNLISARGFAKLLRNHGVTVNATNPGMVMTPLYNYYMKSNGIPLFAGWLFYRVFMRIYAKSAEEGAQTGIYLAVSKEVEGVTGTFFAECGPARFLPPKAKDVVLCREIWGESERRGKLTVDEKLGNPYDAKEM